MTDFERDIIAAYKKAGLKCPYCDIECKIIKEDLDSVEFVCPNCKKPIKVYIEDEKNN